MNQDPQPVPFGCTQKGAWLLFFLLLATPALGQSTGFTYQGRLLDGGVPAQGIYDLRFSLAPAQSGTDYVSGFMTNAAVPITNGLFSVSLDFGPGAFGAAARWLEVAVRNSGATQPYTTLLPRTLVQGAPYALWAGSGGSQELKIVAAGASSTAPYTGYEFSFGLSSSSGTNAVTNGFWFERTSVPKHLKSMSFLLMQNPTNVLPVFARGEVWGMTSQVVASPPCATYLQEYGVFRRAVTLETNIMALPVGTWIRLDTITNGVDLAVNQDELLVLSFRAPNPSVSCPLYWEGSGRAIVTDQ